VQSRLQTILIIFLTISGFILSTSFSQAEYADIVINSKAEAMRKANVGDVIFPHWFHRIRYRCNVCHEDIFKLEAGKNEISMKVITEDQKMCGQCHNGTIAWSTVECERCHFLEPGWSPGPIQHSTKTIANPIFSTDNAAPSWTNKTIPYAMTMQIGAGEHPMALARSGLPLDRFGLIDWAGAVKRKIINPLWSIDPNADITKKQFRNNKILFETKSQTFPDVIFPHDTHSYWLQCKVCHETEGGAIFKAEAGANPVTMTSISLEKKWCARCHGKVGFPISDCARCHSLYKGFPTRDEVITRKKSNP